MRTMRSISTQVRLKRLQRDCKRIRTNRTVAKKNLFYVICRYIRWTMSNGGGLMKVYRLDGTYETFVIGLQTDLDKYP